MYIQTAPTAVSFKRTNTFKTDFYFFTRVSIYQDPHLRDCLAPNGGLQNSLDGRSVIIFEGRSLEAKKLHSIFYFYIYLLQP